mgnify:CR=1 FL=1
MPDVLKIFGPPGTGKTTRLLDVMEQELASGLPPERLAYLTFTVAARREARHRALTRFGYPPERLKWIRTLHSAAYEVLGMTAGRLVTEYTGLEDFAKQYGYELTSRGAFTDDGLPMFGNNVGDKLMAFDHRRRHLLWTLAQSYKAMEDDTLNRWELERFTSAYVAWKEKEGRLDFTDLLERIDERVILPCDVVIVDEAQDLSRLQWRAFWTFAGAAHRIYIAGDDDQAIYEWAGASPDALLAQDGRVEVLPHSYRLPRTVWALAQKIVAPIRHRQQKTWTPRDAEGETRHVRYVDNVSLETGSILALYRNHKYAHQFEEFLRAEGETFVRGSGHSSVPPADADAIITWTRLARGHDVSTQDLEGVLGRASPHRISTAQRAAMRACDVKSWNAVSLGRYWPSEMFKAPWWHVLDHLQPTAMYLRRVIQKHGAAGLIASPRIRLSTIHGAKGAEADHVLLLKDISKMARRTFDITPDVERRVWYVAVTRAKNTLTLIGDDNPIV